MRLRRKRREIAIDRELYRRLEEIGGKHDPPLSAEQLGEALITAGLIHMGVVEGIAQGMDPATFLGEELVEE
jgi:hypothetical protein